jgi:hypothetical protein
LNAIQISADIETSDEEELLVEHIVEVNDEDDVEVNDEDDVEVNDQDDVEVNDEDDVKDEDEVPSLFGLQASFLHQPIRMAGRNCLGIVVAERENDPLDTDSEPGNISFYWHFFSFLRHLQTFPIYYT